MHEHELNQQPAAAFRHWGGGVPREHRVKRVGVLSRSQRCQVHLGTRDPCRSYATASWAYLLRSLIKLLSSSSSSSSSSLRNESSTAL